MITLDPSVERWHLKLEWSCKFEASFYVYNKQHYKTNQLCTQLPQANHYVWKETLSTMSVSTFGAVVQEKAN